MAVVCISVYLMVLVAMVNGASVGVSYYQIPIPNLFNDSTDNGTGCVAAAEAGSLYCFMNAGLIDGNTGPLHSLSSTNLHRFLAWNRTHTQPISLWFGFSPVSSLSSVVLYFFNYPTQWIGLPSVTLRGSSSSTGEPFFEISYVYSNNDVLMNSDSQLRNVSLSITSNNTDNIQLLFIDLVFTNTDIDWILLSEVDICEGHASPLFEPVTFQGGQSETVTLGPNSSQSSVRLSCTVTVSGCFQWTWQHNGDSLLSSERYQILTGDATRSSILVINKLNYTDEGTYSCVVNHVSQTETTSKTFTLQLLAAINATVKQICVREGEAVSVSCEMYGYPRGEIEWVKVGQQVESGGRYNITVSAGTREGQDGRESSVSSVVSQLTIHQVEQRDEGTYTCKAAGITPLLNTTVYIYVAESPIYTTETTIHPTELPMCSTDSPILPTESPLYPESSVYPMRSPPVQQAASFLVPAVAAVVVIIVVLVVVVITIVVVFIIYLHLHGKDNKASVVVASISSLRTDRFMEKTKLRNPQVINDDYTYSVVNKNNKASATASTSHHSGDNFTDVQETTLQNPEVVVGDYTYSVVDKKPLKDHPQKFVKDNKRNAANNEDLMLLSNPLYGSAEHFTPEPYCSFVPQAAEGNSVPIYSVPDHPTSTNQPAIDDHSSDSLLSPIYAAPDLACPLYAAPDMTKKHRPPLEISSDNIREVCEIGYGQFGEVMLAETVGLSLKDLRYSTTDDDKTRTVPVALKRIRTDADAPAMEAFKKEMKFVSQLNHSNVVRLLAISNSATPFMVMEYMENGDLNQFLRKAEYSDTDPPLSSNDVSSSILLSMTIQIADGMAYLARHNFIHRDLATRNVLVGDSYTVKLSDLGLSRNLYESAYYVVKERAKMPVRWMSWECFYDKFSEKSDVWAYGVTVWEIFSLCQDNPYSHLTDREVVDDALKAAKRTILDKPSLCPDKLYEIILNMCWASETSERATFQELFNTLDELTRDGLMI